MGEKTTRNELIRRIKALESKVCESEQLLKSVFDQVAVGIAICNSQTGGFVKVNHRYAEIVGYSIEGLHKLSFQQITHPDDLEKDLNTMDLMLKGKIKSFSMDKRYFRKDGSIVWGRITVSPMWKQGEKPDSHIAILEDITEQKIAEDELRNSENRYKDIFNNLLDIYSETDMDGIILEVSPSFEKQSGYKREEVIGTPARNYYVDPSQREKLLKRLIKDGYVNNFELEFRHKNGHIAPISINSTLQKDEQGNPVKIIGMLRNISEQKKAQETIRENERRYQSIMEASPDPIVIYDMDGNTIYINPAFTRVFGWTYEELKNKKIDYVPYEAWPETQSMIKRIKRGEGYLGFKTKRYDKDRNLLDIDMSFNVWKDKYGEPVGSVVILRDVTEQKKVLAQLQKAQKLEAIGTLAGGIAHDFNNILSGIFGYSQLAKMHLEHPEKARNDIEQIQKAGQKAMELVQQILTISRKSQPKKSPVSIHVTVKEALKLLRASIPTTIEIKEDILSQAYVMADATKIHQIIMNLGTNAYHAMMEQEGILSISLKEFRFAKKEDAPELDLKPGRYLKLDVSDTGCGMDLKTMDKIFDPYFTTKEHSKGTGLGLAVVYGIVEEHKGTILVYSEPGQGTTFQVYLPVLEKKVMERSINVEDDQPLIGSENILLVDDDETVLRATHGILNELGYAVHPFENGKDAFEAYKLNPNQFDLVITDLTMPGMNGFEVSQKILELYPDQPVVLCTGLGESIIREKARSIGVIDFVEKPMITWKIAKTIRSILDRNGK